MRHSDRPRPVVAALGTLAVVVGLGACAPAAPDPAPDTDGLRVVEHFGLFVEYGSAEELAAAADAVVTGVILAKQSELVVLAEPEFTGTDPETNPTLDAPEPGEPAEPAAFVYTVYDVEVTEAVEGRFAAGERIEVRLVGGEHGAELHVWHGVVHPEVGETYAFFLSDIEGSGDEGSGASGVEAEALNPTQSLYLEVADGEFEPVSRSAHAVSEIAEDLEDELGLALD